MGELVGMGGGLGVAGLQSASGVVSAVVSVLALGLFALFQFERKNDDDDDSHGGGLMQPVA